MKKIEMEEMQAKINVQDLSMFDEQNKDIKITGESVENAASVPSSTS